MKRLAPLWFTEPPYDTEHKEYVLLDYLKEVGENIGPENCYSTIREISKLIRELSDFKEKKNDPHLLLFRDSKKKTGSKKKFEYKKLTTEEQLIVDQIVENSLETLYEYSEICLEILKEEEAKIKIFKIGQKKIEKTSANSGILLVRNMISDKIIPYMWQGSVLMKTDEGSKEICILKKVFIKNPNFSLNYEHIYHEVLQESGIKKSSPELFVIEIYENFDEDSEIYKLAKEKFVESISK